MSIISIGGQQAASLFQLMKDKRNATRSMISAVEAGDTAAAQSKTATIQSDQSQIDSIIGSSATTASAGTGLRSTVKSDLSNLLAAVQAGDQTQASAALTQLTADRRAGESARTSSKSLVGDIRDMLSAIVAGDATGASSYAANLQTDLGKVLGPAIPPATSGPADASGPSSGSNGSFLDDLSALISAVQSGNAASTQTAIGTLASDAATVLGAVHHGRRMKPDSATQGGASMESILKLLNSAAASSTPAATATGRTDLSA